MPVQEMSTEVNRDVQLLFPVFAEKMQKAIANCHAAGYPIEIFEAFRSPERQDFLYAQGRTRDGKIVTNARGWQSFHQFGVASDVAIFHEGKWSWDFDFSKVIPFFLEEGLESLRPLEQVHFQLTKGIPVRDALAMTQKSGVQSFWNKLTKKP